MNAKTIFLTGLSAILISAVFFFVDPIPQDLSYHEFADTRSILSVPNFWNVLSNFPFLLVGGAGFYYSRSRNRPGMMADLHIAYLVFFSGIFMTGFGSAYYHYAPGNETLIWDRLPMTIGFMGLVTIIVGEHISLPAAKRMLIPLLLIGAGSVVFWGITEARGEGDLRPYAIVQFLPMLLIPLILLMYRSVFDSVDFLWFGPLNPERAEFLECAVKFPVPAGWWSRLLLFEIEKSPRHDGGLAHRLSGVF